MVFSSNDAASVEARVALMEAALERAADVVGDLTDPAMIRLYDRYPLAREAFERLGLGDRHSLEGQMVETTLFSLMSWLTDETMIALMLADTLPHHCMTLGVSVEWFGALVEEVADLVIGCIPADRPAERTVWEAIRAEVLATIDAAQDAPMMSLAAAVAPR